MDNLAVIGATVIQNHGVCPADGLDTTMPIMSNAHNAFTTTTTPTHHPRRVKSLNNDWSDQIRPVALQTVALRQSFKRL